MWTNASSAETCLSANHYSSMVKIPGGSALFYFFIAVHCAFLLPGLAANAFLLYLSFAKGKVTGDQKAFFANLAICDSGFAAFKLLSVLLISWGCPLERALGVRIMVSETTRMVCKFVSSE